MTWFFSSSFHDSSIIGISSCPLVSSARLQFTLISLCQSPSSFLGRRPTSFSAVRTVRSLVCFSLVRSGLPCWWAYIYPIIVHASVCQWQCSSSYMVLCLFWPYQDLPLRHISLTPRKLAWIIALVCADMLVHTASRGALTGSLISSVVI